MKMTMTVRTFFALTPFLHSHLTHCTPALFLWGYEPLRENDEPDWVWDDRMTLGETELKPRGLKQRPASHGRQNGTAHP